MKEEWPLKSERSELTELVCSSLQEEVNADFCGNEVSEFPLNNFGGFGSRLELELNTLRLGLSNMSLTGLLFALG